MDHCTAWTHTAIVLSFNQEANQKKKIGRLGEKWIISSSSLYTPPCLPPSQKNALAYAIFVQSTRPPPIKLMARNRIQTHYFVVFWINAQTATKKKLCMLCVGRWIKYCIYGGNKCFFSLPIANIAAGMYSFLYRLFWFVCILHFSLSCSISHGVEPFILWSLSSGAIPFSALTLPSCFWAKCSDHKSNHLIGMSGLFRTLLFFLLLGHMYYSRSRTGCFGHFRCCSFMFSTRTWHRTSGECLETRNKRKWSSI